MNYNNRQYVDLVESILRKEEPIYPIQILNKNIVNELEFNDLLKNTDEKRLKRAEQEVKTKPPVVVDLENGMEKLVFNFKSKPSRDDKPQKGYLIHFEGDVKKMFCTCSDFYHRLYDALVQNDLATYDVSDMFKYDMVGPVEQVPKAEPNQELFVCKHLAALRKYI
jgi:hypothetical protein